jgi:acetyl-CoA acetyltransferase
MRGKYVIAGVGHTRYGSLPGRSTHSLHAEAVRNALYDANICKSAVDALLVKGPTSAPELLYGQRLAESLGISPRVGGVWDQGGAANASLIGYAAMAIEHGQCEIAVVTFADNPKTGDRSVYSRARGEGALFGWGGVPAGYAMVARRHMSEFGTRPEHLGAVVVNGRRNAAANINAQLRNKPITLDEYLARDYLVSPLRRDDCALVSDGAASVVVMSARRARELKVQRPVPILGFGQGQTSLDIVQRPRLTSTMASSSAATAFAMAGLKPADIDVAQLYDCFSIVVLMTLEDYGFCKPGESGRFVEDGGLEVGGRLPINTAGGLLAETGMPGMQLIVEGVRQMRGDAVTQVPNAKTCLISNQGGVMHTHSTLILGN